MALEGKIVDFGVADILQLISQQQKTGVLIVERSNESIEVLFWNGMILTSYPSTQNENEELGRKLLSAGIIDEEQLRKASDIQEKNFKHLGEILIDLGLLNKELLEQIMHNQIYDIFSEIFQWKEGSYAFHPKSIELNEKVFSPLGLELIILDVLRMIDELPDILRKVSSMDSVFRKSDRGLSEEDKENFSHEQIMVYKLVNGRNTVYDIMDKSMLGKFNTAKSMVELVNAGYIKVVPKKKHITAESKRTLFKVNDSIIIAGCYGILALLVLVLLNVSPPNIKGTLRLLTDTILPYTTGQESLEENRLLKVKNGLQIYFWEKGKYPDELKELVSAKLLHIKEIKDSRGKMYYYESKGDSYKIYQGKET